MQIRMTRNQHQALQLPVIKPSAGGSQASSLHSPCRCTCRPYIKDAQRILSQAHATGSATIRQQKLDFLHLPIIDGSVTTDAAISRLADDCCARVLAGQRLYIHCWGGHGRTGTLVSGVMLLSTIGVQSSPAESKHESTGRDARHKAALHALPRLAWQQGGHEQRGHWWEQGGFNLLFGAGSTPGKDLGTRTLASPFGHPSR